MSTSQQKQIFDCSDYIFDFVYEVAMGDAIRRTKIAAGSKERFLSSENNAKEARKAVKEYIDAVLYKAIKKDFYDTANNVVNNLSKVDKNFSFGNAQKLINMTAKYFYITICCGDSQISEKLRERFKNCHCPMDRKMLSIVLKRYREAIRDDEEEKKKNLLSFKEDDGKDSRAWSGISWSEITCNKIDRYEHYQGMVSYLCKVDGEDIIPLELDYKYWK